MPRCRRAGDFTMFTINSLLGGYGNDREKILASASSACAGYFLVSAKINPTASRIR